MEIVATLVCAWMLLVAIVLVVGSVLAFYILGVILWAKYIDTPDRRLRNYVKEILAVLATNYHIAIKVGDEGAAEYCWEKMEQIGEGIIPDKDDIELINIMTAALDRAEYQKATQGKTMTIGLGKPRKGKSRLIK